MPVLADLPVDRRPDIPSASAASSSTSSCRWFARCSRDDLQRRRAVRQTTHFEALSEPVLQLSDVADDAYGPALLSELVDHAKHLVERLGVKRAEAFLDEERLGVDSPGLGFDHAGPPEPER